MTCGRESEPVNGVCYAYANIRSHWRLGSGGAAISPARRGHAADSALAKPAGRQAAADSQGQQGQSGIRKRHPGGLDVGAFDEKKVLSSREKVVPPTEFESVPPA